MAFAHPQLLIAALLIVPLGIAVLAVLERRRRADLSRYGERSLLERAGALPGARRRLLAQGLALLGLALAGLALARPQFGAKPVVLTRTGRDVVFALDLSRSMNAEDIPPSRLVAAKEAIREVLEASPGDRVGLVVFGGNALLQVPLTLDHAAFDLFLSAAETDDLSDPGTNLAEALATVAAAFGEDSRPRYRVAVLLSDGESTAGEPGRAVEALRQAGVRVFALGTGTAAGAPIPERVGSQLVGYHRDESGEVVGTRLDERTLREVAEETSGSYLRLSPGSARRLAGELAQLEKREISSRTFTQLVDRYQWPLALALGLLLLESALQAGRARRIRVRAGSLACLLALVAAAVPARAGAQQERPGTEAERLYGAGRFQEAYDAFHRLAEKEGPSPTLSYDMGNSLYRMGRYDTAVGSYREALADSSGIRAESAFNLGNSLFKAAESRPEGRDDLRRAVTAYEDALVLAPRDADAKWNLELALRRLQQEEQQQARGGGGGGGGGGSGQQQASEGEGERREGGGEQGARKGPSPSQGEAADQGRTPSTAALTREQARQLLDAIQSEEGEALDRGDEGRARAASVGRDW